MEETSNIQLAAACGKDNQLGNQNKSKESAQVNKQCLVSTQLTWLQ